MLNIRLQRTGKRGQAYFRVIVVEHTKKPKGEYLELLGNYNPHEKQFKVDKERVEYWISKGAQATPTVNNLMTNYKVWDKPKMQSWKPKKHVKGEEQKVKNEKPVEKTEERSAPAEQAAPVAEQPPVSEATQETSPEAAPAPEAQ